jgi:hypothetical protein
MCGTPHNATNTINENDIGVVGSVECTAVVMLDAMSRVDNE